MTDTVQNKPKFMLSCNLRNEAGSFVDLYGGGGYDPALVGYTNGTERTNSNQIWYIYSVPHTDSRVIIKNSKSYGSIMCDGHMKNARCETLDDFDERGQWFLEGCDIRDISDDSFVRFRNVHHRNCYLDLWEGNTAQATPFITHNGHGASNQVFKLKKRD